MSRQPAPRPLPYTPDSTRLFDRFAAEPWAVFLDSGRPAAPGGRYDIIAAAPHTTLVTRGGETTVCDVEGCRTFDDDPFELLREHLAAIPESGGGLPFGGGAIGYFGYDLARRWERLPRQAADDMGLPEMAVGLYGWAVVVDHQRRESWLVGEGGPFSTLSAPPGPLPPPGPFRARQAPRPALDAAAYGAAFDRIQRYLRDGDCYQVNLAQPFTVATEGDPWQGYRRLRAINPAPFGAYLNLPFAQIMSSSPERFLSLRGGRVESRPIKGTRPRDPVPRRDRELAAELAASAKDRAENLMIVDLLRNDLGRHCRPGSIAVPELFAVESYATVHHLVSSVTGALAPDADALALLRDAFPGGSITGAPKLRAMEIIEELEPFRRGVYCGAIGYLDGGGTMDTNIAIRTAVHREGTVRFWAGGGLVVDSEVAAEYAEVLDKAAAFLRLFGDEVSEENRGMFTER